MSPDLTYQFWGKRDGDLDVEVRRYGRRVYAFPAEGGMLTTAEVRRLARGRVTARRDAAVSR